MVRLDNERRCWDIWNTDFKFFLGRSNPFAHLVYRQVKRRFDTSRANFRKCLEVRIGSGTRGEFRLAARIV